MSAQIISIIVKNDEGWLAGQHSLVSQLRRVWVSEVFQERHRKDNMAATNWKEPKLLAYCLLSYCKYVWLMKLCEILDKVIVRWKMGVWLGR